MRSFNGSKITGAGPRRPKRAMEAFPRASALEQENLPREEQLPQSIECSVCQLNTEPLGWNLLGLGCYSTNYPMSRTILSHISWELRQLSATLLQSPVPSQVRRSTMINRLPMITFNQIEITILPHISIQIHLVKR